MPVRETVGLLVSVLQLQVQLRQRPSRNCWETRHRIVFSKLFRHNFCLRSKIAWILRFCFVIIRLVIYYKVLLGLYIRFMVQNGFSWLCWHAVKIILLTRTGIQTGHRPNGILGTSAPCSALLGVSCYSIGGSLYFSKFRSVWVKMPGQMPDTV